VIGGEDQGVSAAQAEADDAGGAGALRARGEPGSGGVEIGDRPRGAV
jgi:hypothetical protein